MRNNWGITSIKEPEMRKSAKIVAILLAALCLLELAGCKTLAKKLGIPYGQAKKLELVIE